MITNGRTFKEDIKLIVHGVREFERLLPGQMFLVAIKCVIGACFPYVATIAAACIVNELMGEQNHQQLLMYVLLAVGLTLVLFVGKAVLEAKIAVGYSRLFSTHELLLTDKTYRLPYEQLENSRIRNLREQVSGSINVSGAGMASLYWDAEVVFNNLCSAVISLILCVGFFREVVEAGDDGPVVLGYLVCLTLLVILCSFVSCKMTSRRFDVAFQVFEEGAKYKRYGEFYTLEYLSDEDIAMDVRIFGQKDLILDETWQRCYEHFTKGLKKELGAVNRYDGIKLICTTLCGTVVYLVVSLTVLQGIVGMGNVIVLHGAVTGLILALSELAQIWTDLRNNNEHLIRFFEYMDLPEETKCVGRGQEEIVPVTVSEIRFEHVTFQYPETSAPVLQDINLTIKAGEKLAIVGQNGSGKTTLIKLLCRLYQPTKGKILLNGRDIQSYPKEKYWSLIATVFQDFSLFAFSVGENVAATGNYEEERVEAVLRKAGLGEKLAKWKKGIKQPLFHEFEEDGENLSGGEAQKLAIARALYKDAEIMILDEPTAALDPYAEFEIYEQFKRVGESKTLLSISHRLSSCKMCDKILVLDKGRLVQSGRHEKLLQEKEGKYYEMWQAQAQYYH